MALTWRNVDAPDFRGAMNGFAQSNQMLQDALGTASKALGTIDANKSTQVNNQIRLRSMQYDDPAAYAAALKNGQIVTGADQERVDAATLTNLDNRTGTLLERQIEQYKQNRTEQTDSSRDAAAPAIAAMNAAYATGDPRQIAAAQQQYGPQLAQLSGADNAAQWKNVQGLEAGNLSNDSQRFQLDTTKENYEDTQTAQGLFTEISRGAYEGKDALAAVEQLNISPGVRTKLNSLLGAKYGDLYAPGAAGGVTAPAGSSGSAFSNVIGNAETRNYVPKILNAAGPLSGSNSEKAAQLLPHLFNTESGNRQYNADGSVVQGPVTRSGERAQGAGQLMPATAAKPGYGVKPAQNNSEAENRRVSYDYLVAMLNEYGGDAEKALAAYNAGPGTVDKWIASIPADAGKNAASQINNRIMQNTGQGGAATRLQDNFGSNANPLEIANAMSSKDGAMPEANTGRLSEIIRRVMSDANVNAAQAGDMIAAHPQESTWLRGIGGLFGGRNQSENLGGDVRIDDDGLAAEIASHKSGRAADMMLGQASTVQAQASTAKAEEDYNNARMAYQGALSESNNRPALARSLPRLLAQLEKAEEIYNNKLLEQRTNSELQPRRLGKPENEPVAKSVPNGGFTSTRGFQNIGPTPRELLMR